MADMAEEQASKRLKVADNAAAPGDESPEAVTKAFFDRLKAVKQRCATEGVILIRGVKLDNEDEEEEDDPVYTAEQLAGVRHVILTSRRKQMIDDAVDFATCGQAEEMFKMFNTHSGNMVCMGISKRVAKALKLKTLPEQFDSLLALTFAIDRYDSWIHDNECWERGGALEKGLNALAKAWKTLLANTDSALGIDSEYTRAGTEALLVKLEEKAGEQERGSEEDGYDFKWR
jgi:hypothetical protein